jgi:hypothetical protein
MKKIYVSLLLFAIIFFLNSPIFSQSPACASFSGVFISDSLEQNLPEYFVCQNGTFYLKSLNKPVGATYQWKQNGVNIVGETNPRLLIQDIGIFSLTMTVGGCSATSSGIIIRLGNPLPNSINSSGITQACTGDTITLSAPKGIGYTYQWVKDGNLIAGATNSNFKATQSGNYLLSYAVRSCSRTPSLYLTFGNNANPTISTNKTIVCEGRTTTLKATNVNFSHNLQWFKDGVAMSGMNKDSLVVSQTGNYFLQTIKGACTGNSSALNISITNLNLPAPQIQKDHFNAFETCANNVVKLRVKDYNDTTVVWLKDGNVIAGQTGTTLIARESGNYAVRYSGNELCFSQSAVIPVKITDVSTGTFNANNITASSYNFQNFYPTFTGSAPYVYTVNNVRTDIVIDPNAYSFLSNLNAQTLTITKMANACGVGTASGPAIITLGSCATPTQVSISASNNPVCIGGSTMLNAVAQGTGTLTYQWRKDGVNIASATSNNLTLANFSYTDIAKYSVAVTGVCGTVISGTAIQVNANYGDVVFAKLDYPAYTNSDILLTAFSGSSFGNASNAYRWAGPNGFTSTEQNPVIPNGTALNSGTYTVTATNAGGCINYALLSVTVTTAPITLGNLGTTSFCPNGTLSVPFTTTLAIGTLYKVYLSDANGSFRNQTEIGNGMTSPINITFPQYAQAGTRYRIRIVSTSPLATSSLSGYLSTDGQDLTISVKNLGGREFANSYVYVCQGSAITGNISSNQSNVTYEWKKNGISQTNNSALRITNTGNYVAYVNKVGCNSTAKQYVIEFRSVIEVAGSTRLGSYYQCSGSSILYREQYQSDSATYQWKRDGTSVANATSDTLIATQTGTYIASVTDKCPISQTPYATPYQSVLFSNTVDNIKIYSEKRILCGNNSYLFIFGGNLTNNPLAPYSYQWKRNGVNMLNQTSPDAFINAPGIYSLSVSQGNCTNLSTGIEVSKVDTLKMNLKISDGYTNTICNGMRTELNVDVSSGIYPTMYKDGVLVSQIYGSQFFATETGKYHLNSSVQGCAIIPSDTIKISVGDKIKPSISGNSYICQGGISEIYATVFYGPANLTYQWFKNNSPIPFSTSGQISVSQSGYYKLRTISGSCSGFSDSIQIRAVATLPKPKIYANNNDIFSNVSKFLVCSGGTKDLYSVISGYGQYLKDDNFVRFDTTYWKRNNQIFDKVPNDYIGGVKIYISGIYTIIGKKGTCLSPESDPVEIKIGEPITANITGSTSIYPGQKAKLNLNFTGGNAWFYQTSDVATEQTTSLSPTLKNVSPANTQTYSITSVASNCGVGTVTGNATVTVLSCPTDKTISLNSGNWNTATTWTCGQIPTAAYDAIIENGHTVTLPNGYQGITKKLDLRGGLRQGVGAGVRVSN